ncbi:MAG: formylglycine-generating enzyme family protein [bacterium]|nr:formylglycine-generating enzyme family protein [bacterium]
MPPGPFRMGSDSDSDVPYLLAETPPSDGPMPDGFWIGRFPVTQDQFREFVEDGGYADRELWVEAVAAGVWREGHLKIYQWDGSDYQEAQVKSPQQLAEPFLLSNHPVVGVSWFEARAYCRWLTRRLQQEGALPEGWAAGLPSEPEWEKAARGGFQVPSEPVLADLRSVRVGKLSVELTENPQPHRRFPWGDEIGIEHANYWHESGIATTSAIGCFPQGCSPCGCEEMSGSVWEWTRSQRSDYPYPESEEDRAERECFEGGAAGFVLRGGGFGNVDAGVRCAVRPHSHPTPRHDLVGFRVVLSPSGL